MFLFIFRNAVFSASKKKDKHSLSWRVKLVDCRFEEFIDDERNPYFSLVEIRKIATYPFLLEIDHKIYPQSNTQWDYSFWKTTFSKAFSEFWKDPRPILLRHSVDFARHMKQNLLSKNDWLKLEGIYVKKEYEEGEVVFEDQKIFTRVHWIREGQVRFYLPQNSKLVVMDRDSLFGVVEFFLKGDPLNIILGCAATAKTTLVSFDYEELWHLLAQDHPLAERLLRLICYEAACMFISTPFQQAFDRIRDFHRQLDGANTPSSSLSSMQPFPPLPMNSADSSHDRVLEPSTPRFSPSSTEVPQTTLEAMKTHQALSLRADDNILHQYPAQLKPPKGPEGRFVISNISVSFFSRTFGRKTKLIIPDVDILGVALSQDYCVSLVLRGKKDPLEISFKSAQVRADVLNLLIHRISERDIVDPSTTKLQNSQSYARMSTTIPSSFNVTIPYKSARSSLKLSPADWDEILSCSTALEFLRGKTILKQGDSSQKLYQVVSGSCRVELTHYSTDSSSSSASTSSTPSPSLVSSPSNSSGEITSANVEVIGHIVENDVFGDLSFLMGGVAMASVIADEDTVRVVYFERSKLDILLKLNSRLAAGFYKYLAKRLYRRYVKAIQISQSPLRES